MSFVFSSAHVSMGRFFIILTVLLLGSGLWAKEEQEELSEREIFERELIGRAMDRYDLNADPAPEGKTVERVLIARFPIVEQSDPWPNFVNLFHVTTREHIVRQELLFLPGQTYDEDRVRESARNLRLLPLIFSTVRIVTCRGSAPDRVVVLVITKDLWSLRLNSNGNFGGGIFNFFYLTPSEQNFLGLNQRVSLHYYIDRDVHAFGQVYDVPRLLGSRFTLYESMVMRVNRQSSDVEGGYGTLVVGRPLFSLNAQWGFYVQGSFDLGVDRFYEGADYRQIRVIDGQDEYLVPHTYEHRRFSLSAVMRRSMGERFKTVVSFGYNLYSRTYGLTDSVKFMPAHLQELYRDNVVPVVDQAGQIMASVSFYQAKYCRLQNVQTLGLTEDFRLGPSLSLDLSWSNPSFGFSQHALGLSASVGWRFLLAGDLLDLSASAGARFMPDHGLEGAGTSLVNQLYVLQAENISPEILGLGRFLVRLRYLYSQHSLSRSLYSLGGDNTLRGFVSGYTSGERLFNVNAEFRTSPLVLWTVHMGLVLFYDGGDAYGFRADEDFSYHQAVGLGFRTLFPQFDRGTFRIDVGVPLGRDFHPRVIDWVTIAFLQAF